MSCEKTFTETLHAKGFRFTPQREMILEVLHHIPGHSTTEEIYTRVQALSSRVDMTTVYRTLELLQELEFINVIETGDRGRRYELVGVKPPHPHLICRSCGRIVDLAPGELSPLDERMDRDHGFEAEMDQLTIPGTCAACRSGLSASVNGRKEHIPTQEEEECISQMVS